MNGIGRKIKGANNTAGCTAGNEEEVIERRRTRHRRSRSDKNVDVEKLADKSNRGNTSGRPTGMHLFHDMDSVYGSFVNSALVLVLRVIAHLGIA